MLDGKHLTREQVVKLSGTSSRLLYVQSNTLLLVFIHFATAGGINTSSSHDRIRNAEQQRKLEIKMFMIAVFNSYLLTFLSKFLPFFSCPFPSVVGESGWIGVKFSLFGISLTKILIPGLLITSTKRGNAENLKPYSHTSKKVSAWPVENCI